MVIVMLNRALERAMGVRLGGGRAVMEGRSKVLVKSFTARSVKFGVLALRCFTGL
jgi:hypothetical protein